MKKIIIVAILLIALIACAPALPMRNQSGNKSMNKTAPAKEVPKVAGNASSAAMEKNETKKAEPPAKVQEKEVPKANDDLSDVPKKEVIEGELVSFPNLKAVDPDGDPITYTFTAPLNGKGEWKTKDGDVGQYLINISASDGANTVMQQVLIVVKSKNKPPVISVDEPLQVAEGDTITLNPTITDPEGESVNVTYAGWMDSTSKDVGFDESGLHKVMIIASDGKQQSTKELVITVTNTNRPPVLADLDAVTVKEGEKVTVKPSAKDPDGDTVKYSFSEPFDDKGMWQTKVGDAGDYDATVTASDGDQTAEKSVKITVTPMNRAPVIEIDSPMNAKEGDTVTLNPKITDNEGDEVRVTYSGWMNAATKKLTYDDSGSHTVTISARDSAGNEAKKEVVIVVEDVNRPPIFGAGSFN